MPKHGPMVSNTNRIQSPKKGEASPKGSGGARTSSEKSKGIPDGTGKHKRVGGK